jgi:vacuolar-type H+-ATPase subunit H
MAKSYYKYKERDPNAIDYAGASKELSGGLMDVVTGIEADADKLTDDIRKARSTAEDGGGTSTSKKAGASTSKKDGTGDGDHDVPMTDDLDVNTVLLGLVDKGAAFGLRLKNDHDNGIIGDLAYKQKNEALAATFKTLKEVSVGAQILAKETADGMADGSIDQIQQLDFQELISYNLTDSRVKIDIDENGVGYAYRVDDKGVMIPQTKKTMNQLKNLTQQRFPAYDLQGNVDQIVANVGKALSTLGGKNKTTYDLLQNEKLSGSVNGGYVTSMMLIDDFATGLTDTELASILTAQLGSKYKPVNDPYMSVTEDANGVEVNDQYKILYEKDSSPSGVSAKVAKLTPEQRKAGEDFVQREILSRFNVEKPAAAKPMSDAERKAREERDKIIEAAKADVNNLKKIFEAKSEDEVESALSALAPNVIENLPKNSEFMRLESVVVGNSRSINAIYTNEYGKIISEPIVVKIPDNFQDFVDEGGEKLTGNPNLLSLRKESGVGANDQKRGDKGGVYEITVLEENIPAFKSAVTLSDAMDTVESELDWMSYANMGTAYSDMSTAAEDMFKKMGFTDYTISQDGNKILISVDGHDIPAFNMAKTDDASFDGNKHDKRRGDFQRHMSDIYTALTTGKKMGGTVKPAGKPSNTLNATNRNKG